MIIISKTPKMDVLAAIDRERSLCQGLLDNIQLLKDTGSETFAKVEGLVEKNAVFNSIQKELKRVMNPRATLLHETEGALRNIVLWIPKMRSRIEKSRTSTYDKETISFREKGILDAVASINFYSRYASMVIDILLTQAHKDVPMQSYLTKVDLQFVNDTAKYFTHLTVKFSDSVVNLDGMINDLSEEVYDPLSADILKGSQGDKAVALQGLGPHELNPLYWWKVAMMKKDLSSIQSSNEKIEMLASKIARLNNQRTGHEDPALDRAIETYQNEIIKHQAKIVDIEARYHG